MDTELLKELKEKGYAPIPERPDGFGITKLEYAREFHCTRDAARGILEKAWTDGILEKRVCIIGNKTKEAVYFRPGTWPA